MIGCGHEEGLDDPTLSFKDNEFVMFCDAFGLWLTFVCSSASASTSASVVVVDAFALEEFGEDPSGSIICVDIDASVSVHGKESKEIGNSGTEMVHAWY